MSEVGIDSRAEGRRRSIWRCSCTRTGRSRSPAAAAARMCPASSKTGWSPTRGASRSRRCGEIRDELEQRVLDLIEKRIDAIRGDRSAHDDDSGSSFPLWSRSSRPRSSPEEIRACVDAVLAHYDDAPVRSFLLTLANRATRECLRADRCYELVS